MNDQVNIQSMLVVINCSDRIIFSLMNVILSNKHAPPSFINEHVLNEGMNERMVHVSVDYYDNERRSLTDGLPRSFPLCSFFL